jgi:hypothetical protein
LKEQAWFERKVSELGARLAKLLRDRQEQLEQDQRVSRGKRPA